MPLKVNLAHHPLDALCVVVDLGYVFPQEPTDYVLRGGGAGCCLANPWPRSSGIPIDSSGGPMPWWRAIRPMEQLRSGVSRTELKADFPQLSRQALDYAQIQARLPKPPGRPRRPLSLQRG